MRSEPIGVLLAAGLGTRLRPLTLARPKPLVPIHGIPLLEFGLRQLEAAGCRLVAVNGHHLAGLLAEWLAARQRREPRTELRFFAEPELLGVGGGLSRMARELPPGPLLVQNGDVLHDADLSDLWRRALEAPGGPASGGTALVLGGEPLVAEAREGRVQSLRDPGRSTHGFTGIHLWGGEARRRLQEWRQADIVPFWTAETAAGRAPAALEPAAEALWVDLGHVARYLPLHAGLWERPAYRALMARLGLTACWDPARRLSLGADSRLPEEAANCVAWDGVAWEGEARDTVFLDGVRGRGRAAGEIVLAARADEGWAGPAGRDTVGETR